MKNKKLPEFPGPGENVMMQCPAHDDQTASLSVKNDQGKILLHCFAGCDFSSIVKAWGMAERDFSPDEVGRANGGKAIPILRRYPWSDVQGHQAWHLRLDSPDKKFVWAQDQNGTQWGRGNCQPDLWQREKVVAAPRVVLCEGERDVETVNQWLEELGLTPNMVATCTANGAGSVKPKNLEILHGKTQVLLSGDNDNAGKKYVTDCGRVLEGTVHDLRVFEVPAPCKDWTEWQEQGGTAEPFKRLVEGAPPRESSQDGIQLTSFDQIVPESVEWAWHGRVAARGITLIVGQPGQGKTTIALDLAARWSRGEQEGDWYGKPVTVVIASCEDSPSTTLRPRLEAAGANLSNVHLLQMRRDGVEGGITIPEDLPALEAEMKKLGARVLIIDPVMGHLGDVDSYKDQNIRKALAPLAGLAERLDAVVIGIMHLNKRDCASITTRVGGSVGFVATARSVLLVGKDPDSEEPKHYALVHAKSNLGPHAATLLYGLEERTNLFQETVIVTSGVVWRGESDSIHAGDVLGSDAAGGNDSGEKAEAKAWLLAFLENETQPGAEVLKAAKSQGVCSESTLKRAKKELGIKAEKVGFGRGGKWMWALPEGDAKGYQMDSKEGHPHNGEPLRETRCKKSKNSNDLLKGVQGFADETLSGQNKPLNRPNQADLFRNPGKEVVMERGGDDPYEEISL